MVELIIAGCMTSVVFVATMYWLKKQKKQQERERIITNCHSFKSRVRSR